MQQQIWLWYHANWMHISLFLFVAKIEAKEIFVLGMSSCNGNAWNYTHVKINVSPGNRGRCFLLKAKSLTYSCFDSKQLQRLSRTLDVKQNNTKCQCLSALITSGHCFMEVLDGITILLGVSSWGKIGCNGRVQELLRMLYTCHVYAPFSALLWV